MKRKSKHGNRGKEKRRIRPLEESYEEKQDDQNQVQFEVVQENDSSKIDVTTSDNMKATMAQNVDIANETIFPEAVPLNEAIEGKGVSNFLLKFCMEKDDAKYDDGVIEHQRTIPGTALVEEFETGNQSAMKSEDTPNKWIPLGEFKESENGPSLSSAIQRTSSSEANGNPTKLLEIATDRSDLGASLARQSNVSDGTKSEADLLHDCGKINLVNDRAGMDSSATKVMDNQLNSRDLISSCEPKQQISEIEPVGIPEAEVPMTDQKDPSLFQQSVCETKTETETEDCMAQRLSAKTEYDASHQSKQTFATEDYNFCSVEVVVKALQPDDVGNEQYLVAHDAHCEENSKADSKDEVGHIESGGPTQENALVRERRTTERILNDEGQNDHSEGKVTLVVNLAELQRNGSVKCGQCGKHLLSPSEAASNPRFLPPTRVYASPLSSWQPDEALIAWSGQLEKSDAKRFDEGLFRPRNFDLCPGGERELKRQVSTELVSMIHKLQGTCDVLEQQLSAVHQNQATTQLILGLESERDSLKQQISCQTNQLSACEKRNSALSCRVFDLEVECARLKSAHARLQANVQ